MELKKFMLKTFRLVLNSYFFVILFWFCSLIVYAADNNPYNDPKKDGYNIKDDEKPWFDGKNYPLSSSEVMKSGSLGSGPLGSSQSGTVKVKNYMSDDNPIQKTKRSKKDKHSKDSKRQSNKEKESSLVSSQIDKKLT